MNKTLMLFAAAASCLLFAGSALSEDRATKKEATDMVKKAVAAYKAKGEKVFPEITAPSKTFVSKDLYIVAYSTGGKCLAHGQNPKMAGVDLLEMKDPGGKPFVKERVELAKTKDSFWQDYKFTDPLTKRIMDKEAYCEKADATVIICGGVYKQ